MQKEPETAPVTQPKQLHVEKPPIIIAQEALHNFGEGALGAFLMPAEHEFSATVLI